MIELRNLSVKFGEKVIFDGFHLDLPDTGVVVLMGESGVGKTTLLRVLCGVLKPNAGTISGLEERRVSIAFQEPRLLEWQTALENVASVSDMKIAKMLLAQLSMEGELHAKAATLSGGQKQRVSLARALAYGNDVVLLDEPFTGLDDENKVRAAALIRSARLAIVVTHDETDAILLNADKKILL